MVFPESPLLLASGSPRRLALLEQIGLYPDKIISPDIDETPHPGELPRSLVQRLSQTKAKTAHSLYPNYFIIAADTAVACGRRIMGKPSTPDEQKKFLELLSGRRHRVYTSVCVANPLGIFRTRIVITHIRLKRLSMKEIDNYIQTGEGHDKAGGYAIQGKGAIFAQQINGSFDGVVGLPLCATYQLLVGLGFNRHWTI